MPPLSSLRTLCLLAIAPIVLSFGTVNFGGQFAEHEHITRNALACSPGTRIPGDCFEAVSIAQLAGQEGSTGAVGSPDITEILSSVAHCDDADYLDFAKHGIKGTYPRSRAVATEALRDCVAHLSYRFSQGLDASARMLGSKNNILVKETSLDEKNGGDCTFLIGSGRAKCDALEGFGRALHGVQDFYSHSNWADEADTAKPIDITNPPGLHLAASSFVLDLRSAKSPKVPPELSTGCFILEGSKNHDGAQKCMDQGRITHVTMNKDDGMIQVIPGVPFPLASPLTSAPNKPRGMVGHNFELAVDGAIIETRRQWRDFRAELVSKYGTKQASLMVCALTRDKPWKDCTGRKLALVIDSSGSNTETDPSRLRVTAAKELSGTLVTEATVGPDNFPDLVTVITFTDTANVLYPLGDPTSATFDGVGADGGTYIAGGVALAIDQLTKDTEDPTQDHAGIVVFTDGQDSDISDLLNELGRASQLGIRVSFGFLSPVPAGVVRRTRKRANQDRSSAQWLRTRQAGASSTLPDDALLSAILNTGGFFGTISSAEAQTAFVQLVIARGSTNINSISPSHGGPLFPGVTIVSLAPSVTEPDVFTYHAVGGQNLTFETQVVKGSGLNVTLHDVRASEDLATVTTNAQGLATIVYEASSDADVELIVGAIGQASNSTGLFTVDLNVAQASGGSGDAPGNNCTIAADSPCPTIGEIKCCGSGFVTCDNVGYVFRNCGPGTLCKDDGSGVFCGFA